MSDSEEELVQRARRGDLEAFNRLVVAYQGQVYALAYRLLGDGEAAADAAQEAFLAAFQHLGRFQTGSFRAWLLRITANFCYDVLRKRRTRPQASLESLPTHPEGRILAGEAVEDPTAQAEQEELSREIQQALNTLPPEQRAAVVLCDIEELPYDQAAHALGISLGTLKSRLSRGRARLRAYFVERRELLPATVRSIFASPDSPEEKPDEPG
ncbi:MAG: RNA polymerase sigma factor [Chloroflexia bacterium]